MSGAQYQEHLSEQNQLVALDEKALFAVRPDGEMLAYTDGGLSLLRLTDGSRQRLSYDSPDTLLWALDGQTLLASYDDSEQTRLVSFSDSFAAETKLRVEERLTDLAWLADGRLVAIGQKAEETAEGFHLQVNLLLWDGSYDVQRRQLYEAAFPPEASSRLIDQYELWHFFDLSPLKDELIYNRYLNPFSIGGRNELVLYNLLTGLEVVLAKSEFGQTAAVFTADAERVLLPAGLGQIIRINPWTGRSDEYWPGAGHSLVAAPNRDLYLLDGNLYAGKQLLVKLPESARGQFSASGKRLFVAWNQALYLLEGYSLPEEFRYSDLEKVKLQRIRQQRSRGQISLRDYSKARNNILNP